MKALTPKLETLPVAQRSLWKELAEVPKSFVLYGGTAIAIRLGHRTSINFDFFPPIRWTDAPSNAFGSCPGRRFCKTSLMR